MRTHLNRRRSRRGTGKLFEGLGSRHIRGGMGRWGYLYCRYRSRLCQEEKRKIPATVGAGSFLADADSEATGMVGRIGNPSYRRGSTGSSGMVGRIGNPSYGGIATLKTALAHAGAHWLRKMDRLSSAKFATARSCLPSPLKS